MRLNKFIAESGLCSRRQADDWIEQGRVRVNGKVAGLGTVVNEGDDVRVNGRLIGARRKEHVYLAFNKPRGITCTTERNVPGNIVSLINLPQRIFPIGRLDKESEGLILLTSNGDIVNEVLRYENRHEKEYIVTVTRPITDDFLAKMAHGVRLPELKTVTRPCQTSLLNTHTFRIILTQGLNRQIRRMCDVFGYNVKRLQRVRIMHIRLDRLKSGHWRNLRTEEIQPLLPRKNKVSQS